MVLAIAALALQLATVPQAAIQPTTGPDGTRPASADLSADTKPAAVTPSAASEANSASNRNASSVNDRLEAGLPTSAGVSAENRDAALDADQAGRGLSTIRVPEIKNGKSEEIKEPEIPSRRAWFALALVEHGAATFDAYSTRQAVSNGAVEDDPIMRPFAHSGAMYAAVQVGPLLFDYMARRMQRSDNLTMRRIWWLPQSLSTGVSLFAGVHNLHVANSQTK
ncbi:MAG TPA: hypothetical protein VMJ93_01010 [Verrucomicrobiae bacterium]|nr:hypothetical protein [Verrucomicrobiae bacterium]